MVLGPAQVHAFQHLGPILRFGSPSAGMDGQDSAVFRILASKQSLEFQSIYISCQKRGLGHDLGLYLDIPLVDRKIQEFLQVRCPVVKSLPPLGAVLQEREPPHVTAGGTGIIPEVRFGTQRLEVVDFLACCVNVKDAPLVC